MGFVHNNQPQIHVFLLNSSPKFIYVSDLGSTGFILIGLGITLMYYLANSGSSLGYKYFDIVVIFL